MGIEAECSLMVDDEPTRPEALFASPRDFIRGELYQDSGMKELIVRFYQGIHTNGVPPIPYREILLTARIMDEIFQQVAAERSAREQAEPTARQS